MQYRSGSNRHEPLFEDKRSRVWKFIIRGVGYNRLPEAFVTHVNMCAWIASPQGRSSNWLLRGVIQTVNPRNYYVLKSRYCKQAEWIPIQVSDQYQIDEFTVNPLPVNAVRFFFRNDSPTPLHKVGYNIVVPDLIEDYTSVLWQEEVDAAYDADFEAREIERKKRKRQDQDYWAAKIAADTSQDIVFINPHNGEEMGGVQAGHYWTKTYNKRTNL